jgi:hypothetical protein
MKLTHVSEYRSYLEGYKGVYEIGFLRGALFQVRYIGKAEHTCLYTRLSSYVSESRCHNVHIKEKLYMPRHNLWFHVFRTNRPELVESRMLGRHGYSLNNGNYLWNQKDERKPRENARIFLHE